MFKLLSGVFVYGLLLTWFVNPATAFDSGAEVKITTADGAASDYFGRSVSIDGSRMAVGAYGADVGGNSNQGVVYIYDFDGSTWSQTAKLTASDGAANALFGRSVSLSADRLAVGAPFTNIGSNGYQGASYVFELSNGAWSETDKLTASDGAAYDFFGWSISLDGDHVAVGADSADVGSNSNQGGVYVFDLSNGGWSETKLTATDGAADDGFGGSLSLDNSRLVVAASAADINGNSDQGAAYLYDFDGASWGYSIKLTAADGAAYDFFGSSVSLNGDRLAVGGGSADIGGNSNQGSTYVFDFSSGTWSETTKLTASDGASSDAFGDSVSLFGDRLVVGAYHASVGGNSEQGAAYVFNLSNGVWGENAKLVASEGTANDYFGFSVSLSGGHLTVGAYGDESSQGAVYLYTDDVIFKNGFEGD